VDLVDENKLDEFVERKTFYDNYLTSYPKGNSEFNKGQISEFRLWFEPLIACRLPDVPVDADEVEVLAEKFYPILLVNNDDPVGWKETGWKEELRALAHYVLSHYGRGETEFIKSGYYDGETARVAVRLWVCCACTKRFDWLEIFYPPPFCPHCGRKAVEKWDGVTERRVGERRQGEEWLSKFPYPGSHFKSVHPPIWNWQPNARTGKDRRKHNPWRWLGGMCCERR
ncbi:hypothetical protein LCGC14_1356610, partial [marine sediment metagenome]